MPAPSPLTPANVIVAERQLSKETKRSNGSKGSKDASNNPNDARNNLSTSAHPDNNPNDRQASKPSNGTDTKMNQIKSMEELDEALAAGQMDEVAGKYSRLAFLDAECCPAVILMNHGRFEDLSFQDVRELFNCLDEDRSGLLDFDEIALLLQEVLDPPCTPEQVGLIYEITDKNEDGATVEELYRALTAGPVKDHLKRLQRENRLKQQFEHALGINQQVERKLMVERLRWSVEKDDAFKTLPFSLVYICIFIFLVIAHLKVWERQQVERGLQSWITGYGGKLDGPYFMDHVADVPSTFDWLAKSGLPAILGVCVNETTPDFNCYVGTRNLLLGDLELRQTRFDGSEPSVWLLHADEALLHLKTKPGDYLGAATSTINSIVANSWADAETMTLELRFVTYGKDSQMFLTTSIGVSIDDYGVCSTTVSPTAVVVRPYPDDIGLMVAFIIADLLYVLFWIIPMVKETKDLVHLMRISGAWDGFVGYWGLWNAVDWVGIIMGIVVVIIWLFMCAAMQAEELHSMLYEEDGEWHLRRSMEMDIDTIVKVKEKCVSISSLYFTMHLIMGGAAISIMLKFFKAFQANPRLQLVTNTLVRAGSDIFHFSVVFLAVFLGFAVTGHILLGNDLVQFRSFSNSIDTCFIVLMGEFGWYDSVSHSDDSLASGLPFGIVMIWFWGYMIFVLLIMINMLLAIVLEHYTELVHEVSKDAEAISLWVQTSRYLHHARKTKDHIPLAHLLCELEDDDTPCHTEEMVTQQSISQAFPKMNGHQAEHLFTWLKEEARRQNANKDDEMLARLKQLGQYIEHLAADLHVVKLNTAVCTSRLREGERVDLPGGGTMTARKSMSGRKSVAAGRQSPRPQRQSSPGGAVGPNSGLQDQVESLTLKIGEAIQQMSWQIGGATDKLLSQGSALEVAANEALLAVPMVPASATSRQRGTGDASSWVSRQPSLDASRAPSRSPSIGR